MGRVSPHAFARSATSCARPLRHRPTSPEVRRRLHRTTGWQPVLPRNSPPLAASTRTSSRKPRSSQASRLASSLGRKTCGACVRLRCEILELGRELEGGKLGSALGSCGAQPGVNDSGESFANPARFDELTSILGKSRPTARRWNTKRHSAFQLVQPRPRRRLRVCSV